MTDSNPTIEAVQVPVLTCERCPALCASRTQIVNGRGAKNPTIMIVGEAPGEFEDKDGKPFRGLSGQLLAELLSRAGIEPDEVFLTNSVRCRPPGNRTPKPEEIVNCHDYLIEEIRQRNPAVIVAVGATAVAALYKRIPLTGIMGQILIQPDTGIPVISTYHPAFLMRGNWNKGDLVVAHLEKARRVASGELSPVSLEEAEDNWLAITSTEDVEELYEYLLSDEVEVIALDTETTGLSWAEDELLAISFSALDSDMKAIKLGFTIPIMWRPEGKDSELVPYWGENQGYIIDMISVLLASDKKKAIQNAGFDLKILERNAEDQATGAVSDQLQTVYSFEVNNLAYDPMLLQRIVNENLPANETVLLALYTDMPYYEEGIKEQSQNKKHMDWADPEVMWTYAAADADGLARLVEALYQKAIEDGTLWIHDNIAIPMVRATWNMTHRGIPVDMDYFVRLCSRYDELVAEAEQACYKAAGREFNLNKPKDLQELLFQEMKLPVSGRKTEKAKECDDCNNEEGVCDKHDATGKDALKDVIALLERDNPDHPAIKLIEAILNWKQVAKRKSTYVNGKNGDKGLLRFIRENGRVHPNFNVNRADTGRLAANDPPIQTIPKRVEDEVLQTKDQLRRIFVAPPGQTLMEMDWSQGEVWVMAYESGDETLMRLLKEGRDVHSYVARTLASFDISRVFPKEIEMPDMEEWEWKKEFDEYRRHGKVFVFGLDYGMTAMGVAERLHCSIEEAQQLVDAFSQQVFPGLNDHFKRIRREMADYGYLKDRFGRKGHFGEYGLVRPFGARGMAYWEGRFRKGVNMPIQAGLSDLHQIVHAELDSDPAISSRYAIINAVHDSVMGLVQGNMVKDKDAIIQTAWMIKEKAETTARSLVLPDGSTLGWEIPVEVQWGQGWGDFQWTLGADGNLKEPKEE